MSRRIDMSIMKVLETVERAGESGHTVTEVVSALRHSCDVALDFGPRVSLLDAMDGLVLQGILEVSEQQHISLTDYGRRTLSSLRASLNKPRLTRDRQYV